MVDDSAVVRFGAFRLVPGQRELTREGAPVALGARAMDILLHLTANAGAVVSKQSLMKAVWPDRIVEENNLTVNMTALRKALGSAPDGQPLIRTVTGRGYMFVGAAVIAVADPLPAAPAISVPTSIPLIGRETAISDLQRLLGAHRIVSIVGPGGVGKTALALNVVTEMASIFAQGVAFADLSTVADPARVPEAVAAALAGGGAGVNTATARLTALLRERRLLLVLDNCEHVVEPVALLVGAILSECPGVAILITSREGLFVQGEQIYRLPPLPVADAVRLFAERAQALSGFELNDTHASSVAAVCTRLDGIPLAIEMAVPRLKVLSPAQLAERLDERFRLLGAPARGATPRHRTLQAVIDWSYDFLTEEERALLRTISAFAGSAALGAIEEIAGANAGGQDVELLDRLTALADKSMVVVETTTPPRFRLLETIRQYAVRKAAEAQETDLPARHAAYFAGQFGDAARAWPVTPGRDWLAAHAPDTENLRSALAWAFSPEGDAALGVQLVASTVPLWWELPETPVAEGQRWLAAAAGRVRPDTPADQQGWLRFGQSWRDFRFADRENLPAALEAVTFFRDAGDAAGLGAALWRAGSAALTRETMDQSESYLVEAEEVLRELPAGKWLALTLIRLGDLRFRQGRLALALTSYQEGFLLSRTTDFWIGLVNGGSNMAELLLAMGEPERALRQLEDLRDELPVGRRTPLMSTLAAHLLVAGNVEETRRAARETIDQGSAIGLASAVAWSTETTALLAASDGDLEMAARLAGYARSVHPSLGTRAGSLKVIAERLYEKLDGGLPAEIRDLLLGEGARWPLATAARQARTVLGPAEPN